MKLSKSRFQQPARVELLPLIDVIFLLLIFFIFVMLKMTMQSSIPVELPQLVESKQQTEELLTITLDADNQIFINEQNSSLAELVEHVTLVQQSAPQAILNQRRSAGRPRYCFKHLRQAAQCRL